jgi:hypothetical protein
MQDRPRTLSDEAERARRRALLRAPHMAPLARYAAALRQRSQAEVPDFDPLDGGINARVLFLFEKPGSGVRTSGFVSRNNDDQTAHNTFNFMLEAGLRRADTCIWNIVPYGNGGERVTPADLELGAGLLSGLFDLLPAMRVIVLVGRKAERARPMLADRGWAVLASCHPSQKNYTLARRKWLAIPRVWARTRDYWAQ